MTLEADAEGVIFAQEAMFGGFALYIKAGALKYVYNYVGLGEQMIVADEKLPTGECVLGVNYDMERIGKQAARGTLSLFINDRKAGEKKIPTQLGKFSLAGEGLNVGRAPVTNDYPGGRPWAFSGGTIKQVIADVSGESYVGLVLAMAGRLSGRNGARRLAAFQVIGCKRQSQTPEVQGGQVLIS